MKLKAGHVAATQQYVRNEGAALVRALPQGSRDNLHYFETVSVLHAFNPLPPLRGKALSQRAFYHLVLTDWSLFVVARNPGNEGGVEVEIPLLAIKDMVGPCSRVVLAQVHGCARHMGALHRSGSALNVLHSFCSTGHGDCGQRPFPAAH